MSIGPAGARGGLVAAALLALTMAGAPAATASSDATGEACAGDDGVTVVVDLTDLGGGVEVGCAPGDPATGREALESAGFTPTDAAPGFICAVDGLPDPCPEEFEGSYWSYWSAGPETEWTAHTEGADTTDPAPGDLEGWRYNDGSDGPGVAPAELTAVAATDATAATADTASQGTADAAPADEAGISTGAAVALGGAVALLLALGVALRRRGSRGRP